MNGGLRGGTPSHGRTPAIPAPRDARHVELVAAKRLSDRGRRRLEELEAQVRLLTQLLDRPTAMSDQPSAPVDPAMLRQVISELDAVLTEEGSGPAR